MTRSGSGLGTTGRNMNHNWPEPVGYAAISAVIAGLLAWVMRGFSAGRTLGRMEKSIEALTYEIRQGINDLHDRIDKMETRINAHLDRKD